MAPGFPLEVAGIRVLKTEALYQACRFPHRPDVQRLIGEERSPMTAKMRSKPYRDQSRPDWDEIRIEVMRWCVRVKLVQNRTTFGDLLLATGARPIVEESTKDGFWGACLRDGALVGRNVLGRVLLGLREELREHPEAFDRVQPPAISTFDMLGEPIGDLGPPEVIEAETRTTLF